MAADQAPSPLMSHRLREQARSHIWIFDEYKNRVRWRFPVGASLLAKAPSRTAKKSFLNPS